MLNSSPFSLLYGHGQRTRYLPLNESDGLLALAIIRCPEICSWSWSFSPTVSVSQSGKCHLELNRLLSSDPFHLVTQPLQLGDKAFTVVALNLDPPVLDCSSAPAPLLERCRKFSQAALVQ